MEERDKLIDTESGGIRKVFMYKANGPTAEQLDGDHFAKPPPLSDNKHSQHLFDYTLDGNDSTTAQTQRKRQEQLRRVCERRKQEYDSSFYGKNKYQKVLGFGDHVAYCRAYKSATTYSLIVLERLFNCKFNCYAKTSDKFQKLNPAGREAFIKDRFSFFFVREPYQRLFSLYSNKFYSPKPNWAPLGQQIIKRYRLNATTESLTYGNDVTFLELIEYVVDSHEHRQPSDMHVTPVFKLCDPCNYKYTFIGQLETLETDFKFLRTAWSRRKWTMNISTSESDPEHLAKSKGLVSPVDSLFHTMGNLSGSPFSNTSFYRRMWSYYHISGLISKEISAPDIGDGLYNRTFVKQVVLKAISHSKEQFGDAVKHQKHEALLQAYASIPDDLLERLTQVLSIDCELFGYDNRPSWIFGNRDFVSKFNYFKWT